MSLSSTARLRSLAADRWLQLDRDAFSCAALGQCLMSSKTVNWVTDGPSLDRISTPSIGHSRQQPPSHTVFLVLRRLQLVRFHVCKPMCKPIYFSWITLYLEFSRCLIRHRHVLSCWHQPCRWRWLPPSPITSRQDICRVIVHTHNTAGDKNFVATGLPVWNTVPAYRWKRLCLVSWAAAPCVLTLRALTRNLLTYLLTYLTFYKFAAGHQLQTIQTATKKYVNWPRRIESIVTVHLRLRNILTYLLTYCNLVCCCVYLM